MPHLETDKSVKLASIPGSPPDLMFPPKGCMREKVIMFMEIDSLKAHLLLINLVRHTTRSLIS